MRNISVLQRSNDGTASLNRNGSIAGRYSDRIQAGTVHASKGLEAIQAARNASKGRERNHMPLCGSCGRVDTGSALLLEMLEKELDTPWWMILIRLGLEEMGGSPSS